MVLELPLYESQIGVLVLGQDRCGHWTRYGGLLCHLFSAAGIFKF